MHSPGSTHDAPIGRHVVADFWTRRPVTDSTRLSALMRAAVDAAGMTVVGEFAHAFTPHGLTGFLLLAESHLSVHTWPERGYIAVDIFTCGEVADPQAAIESLRAALEPDRVDVRTIERGCPAGPPDRAPASTD